jgi:hypothetical protein
MQATSGLPLLAHVYPSQVIDDEPPLARPAVCDSPVPLRHGDQAIIQEHQTCDLDVVTGEWLFTCGGRPPIHCVPEPRMAHSRGADVADQPGDVRGVRGVLLHVRHGVPVPVLQRSPRLVNRIRIDGRTGVQEPVELVLPADLVRGGAFGGRVSAPPQLDVRIALLLPDRGLPESAEE